MSVVHVVKNALAVGGQAQVVPGQTLDKVRVPLVVQVGAQHVILLFGLLDLGVQRLTFAAQLRQAAALYPRHLQAYRRQQHQNHQQGRHAAAADGFFLAFCHVCGLPSVHRLQVVEKTSTYMYLV